MREGTWITLSLWGMACAGIVYSFSTQVPFAIIVLTFSGLMNAPSSIARRIVIQRNTPREMRGRVNSAFFVARDVLYLIGMGAAGLADMVDIRLMYLSSAILVLFSGIWIFFLPGLRQEVAQWKKAVKMLYSASKAPNIEPRRGVTPSDLVTLTELVPPMAGLDQNQRETLINTGEIVEVAAGATIIAHDETGDDVYFVLSGRTIAGVAAADGGYRSLSSMTTGDFFGEIAALTGAVRTADVVAEQPVRLLKVPAEIVRSWMQNPAISSLLLSAMGERLNRTSIKELPRFAGVDQGALLELRSTEILEPV
jgi:CRP-like cAMP-binding protein